MQPAEKSRQFNKDRFDTLSISRYVIKKNQSRGPRHGPSMRQTMYHKARDVLRKAKLPKNGSCQTILERWYGDNKYRKSLSQKNKSDNTNLHWKTTFLATPGERRRWEKNCHIFLIKKENVVRAKHAYRQQYKEHAEGTGEGNKSIHPAERTRQNYRQDYEGSEEYTYTVHPRTGWIYYPSTSSSSSSQWQQNNEWQSNQSWDCCRSSTWTEQYLFF